MLRRRFGGQSNLRAEPPWREYPSAALFSAVAPQNLVLLQVSGDVEVFTPLAAPLFEVSDGSLVGLIHYNFSNAHFSSRGLS